MSQKKPNIVQAEFFLIQKGGRSLESVMDEARSRVDAALEEIRKGVPPELAGSRIKVCVRFFDQLGVVSTFVHALQKYKDRYQAVRVLLTRAHGVDRLFLKVQAWFLLERIYKLEGDARFDIVFDELCRALQSGEVAVEEWDHRYRLVQRNEIHELLESIARADTNFWLFLFRHNDLLVDDQFGITELR